MLPKISTVMRLYKDPSIKYSQDGKAICKLGLVASEKYGDKETQFFVEATAWGKTAELLNSTRKGQRVFITGRISTDTWEKDGQKQSKTVLTIESFEYIEKRDENQSAGGNQSQPQQYQQPQQSAQQPSRQMQPELPSIDIEEDEIPFGYIGLQDKRILHII